MYKKSKQLTVLYKFSNSKRRQQYPFPTLDLKYFMSLTKTSDSGLTLRGRKASTRLGEQREGHDFAGRRQPWRLESRLLGERSRRQPQNKK